MESGRVSGPIQKKSSMSDDSSSDMMELDESALVADPHLEQNLRRLQEEERLLLEQQTAMEAGTVDDIAALEHQDALRLNQLEQQELRRQKRRQAARYERYQLLLAQELSLAQAHGSAHGPAHAHAHAHAQRSCANLDLQQVELQRQAQQQAARIERFQQAQEPGAASLAASLAGRASAPRRRAACTVRVNNLHSAEAIETDV